MSRKKILVVEDEPLVGLELKENLERKGYVVPDVIESGEDFDSAVSRYRPDLVLMDIRLKGEMDGIQAASRVKAAFNLPVIYLTAYSDKDTLARAAKTEPAAFLLKPFDERELSANIQMALAKSGGDEAVRRELLGAMSLVDAMEDPALIADTRGRIAHLNAAAVRTLNVAEPSELVRVPLSHILELPADSSGGAQPGLRVNRRGASAVVASMEKLLRSDGREYGSLVVFGSMKKRESRLLETSANEANSTLISYLPGPGAAGPGYRVGGFLEPCLSGSGDFFDVFPADDDTTAFYSLDVMGHGIIASLMAFSLHELLPLLGRSSAGRTPSPSDVLRNLYGRYCQRGASRTLFFTISYGVIKNATGEYRAARGGHIPLIHLALDGEVRVHTTKGSAVGIQEDVEVEESRGVLEPGGRLILVSDGVAESFGGDRSMDSALARIRDFSASFRNVDLGIFVDSLRRQVRREAVGRMTEDDKSMLVIERQRRP